MGYELSVNHTTMVKIADERGFDTWLAHSDFLRTRGLVGVPLVHSAHGSIPLGVFNHSEGLCRGFPEFDREFDGVALLKIFLHLEWRQYFLTEVHGNRCTYTPLARRRPEKISVSSEDHAQVIRLPPPLHSRYRNSVLLLFEPTLYI